MTVTLRRVIAAASFDDAHTDAKLLRRFLDTRDQSAFAALVQRHGSLVLGVCRRALGATPDADDAFQATFLVLVRKADTTSWRGNLGPWLYGVACRISRKARFKRDRRFAVEKQVTTMPHPEHTPPDASQSEELSRAFDEELEALPEAMRNAVVLCELQGRSRHQAAKELRVSEGTLSSRLARARKVLRERLAKRGFALVIPASVILPARLTAVTVKLANSSVGVVPATVLTLTQEAMKTMTLSKLKLGMVLAAMAVGFTTFGLSVSGNGEDKPQLKAAPQVKAESKEPEKTMPVATIHGQDVSREEFGEYLIRKYGAKEIEAFVSQKIIQTEAKKQGVSISEKELIAALKVEAEDLNVEPGDFAKTILPKHGFTEADWRDNVLLPRLLLAKLRPADVAVTEEHLKNIFDRKYGEKRKAQIAFWPKTFNEKTVRELYERVKKEPLAFDQFTVRQIKSSNMVEERVLEFQKGASVNGEKKVSEVTFALKHLGEVSDLIETESAWYAVKLVEIIPAVKGKKFEDEKASLTAIAAKEKLEQGIPAIFARLKQEAKPVYHLLPEPKSSPSPVMPQKK